MHAGAAGVPTVEEYLTAQFTAGQTLLLDGSCAPAATVEKYRAALEKSGAALADRDIVSPLWADVRPALPNTPCELLTPAQTGATVAEKLAAVRAELRKAGATALAVPQLDCLAWLLDLRARVRVPHAGRLHAVHRARPPARGRRGRAGRKRRGAARLRRVPALPARLR